MVEKIAFDKQGHKILPDVHLGNERLSNRKSGISGGNFAICETHGTVPVVMVRTRLALVKCCRHCIKTFCANKITTAEPAIEVTDHNTEHPNGHSY